VGAHASLLLAGDGLVKGARFALAAPGLLPLAGGLSLRLDPFGAFFLGVVGLVAAPAAVYGLGYTHAVGQRPLRLLGAMLNLFCLSMSFVPLADDVLTFLLAWEAMSLASYLLLMTEAERPGTPTAGLWYLGMTQVGLVFLLSAFLLLGGGVALAFGDLRTAGAARAPELRNAVFVLALLGFGSKAGIVPLHVWLPEAHPAAPSHVSALMSGVMIKLGVYGIVRVSLDLLGGGPAWWGGLVLSIGAVSALLGVLYALMEHDLKRLLAYHSVENVGIIVMGVGAGLLFHSHGFTALAALGLVGGLYHTVNHASFKALLFLGAGSVYRATGTRNMEELGGLVRRMPRTAACFLVGAVAISALPPLNGFVSEWLVFQALLGGAAIPRAEVAVLMPIAVAMLALTSGLAAACFVKAFGIAFLGLARSAAAEAAHESPRSMQVPMVALAVVCALLGVGAFAVTPVLGVAVGELGALPSVPLTFTLSLPPSDSGAFGRMASPLLPLGLILLVLLVPLGLRVFGVTRRLRVGDTWGCGRIGQTPRMQYTGTAFAEPLRRIFAAVYRPTEDVTVDFHPGSRYFVQAIEYRAHIVPWFERYLYEPVIGVVRAAGARARRIQSGSVHAYLAYLVAALVALLGLLMRWAGP
jgi:hydrogenase-4 component B